MVRDMYTIKNNSMYQYEIKKSKFITLLYKVNNVEDVNNTLQEINKTYNDAKHCCFAYNIDDIQKFSDDGEPGGTAGLPIMEILNKKNLNFILCVVVRYFGGIKLGAGGLIRAYSKATNDAIENNKIIELKKGYLIKIEANYDEQKQLDYMFSKNIKNKKFDEKVVYYIEIEKDRIDDVINFNTKIINEIWIEKEL